MARVSDIEIIFAKAFAEVLNRYMQMARNDIRQQWSKYDKIDGKTPKIRSFVDRQNELMGIVTGSLIASGRKAWIIEFGRGSLMEMSDEENPWLSEYISSDDFNRERIARGMAILGRPAGEYSDLDGGTQYSTGRARGRDLETWHRHVRARGRNNYVIVQPYVPIPPSHIIRSVVYESGLLKEMQEDLVEAGYNAIYKYYTQIRLKDVVIKV